MKLIIRDLREVEVRQEKAVRFSLTLTNDAGEPEITFEGFVLDRTRRIFKSFVKMTPGFQERLRDAVLAIEGVEDTLGPYIQPQGPPRIEGEKQI